MWLLWYLLQRDMCGVKRDPDLPPAETAAFSRRELIAMKQELQEDAKVSHSSHFMNNIATATTWKMLPGALGDSALCSSNMKALCLDFLWVSIDHVGHCMSLCVTCWLLVLMFGCVRWYSACYWPPALRARWSLQWLVVPFLYHSTVPCICCVHQQSTRAVPCSCSCWYWIEFAWFGFQSQRNNSLFRK